MDNPVIPAPEDTTEECTCVADRSVRGWRDPHCPTHGEFPIVQPIDPIDAAEDAPQNTHAALVEGLRTYGRHTRDCDARPSLAGVCTCGFDALLAQLETRA